MLVHSGEYEHASEKSAQTLQEQTYMYHFKTAANVQIYFVRYKSKAKIRKYNSILMKHLNV